MSSTQYRANGTPAFAALCAHDNATAARLPGDTIASVWECEECGHLEPFTDANYAFANAQPWSPLTLAQRLAGVRSDVLAVFLTKAAK